MQELQIIQKTFDMMKYGYQCLAQFPRSEKHTLAAEIKRQMVGFLRLLESARRRRNRWQVLVEADVELQVLKWYLRLAKDLGFLPFRKYELWSRQLVEIGKMLGGWIRSTK